MSILIKGMKMPKKCSTCPFVEDDFLEDYFSPYCPLTGERPYGNERLNSCPLIELPPHGRLGDLDALLAEFERMQKLNDTRGHEFACSFMSSGMEISTEWYCVEDAVNAAKTIIPAEGGDANARESRISVDDKRPYGGRWRC